MPFLPSPKVNKIELKNHLSKYFSLGKLLYYKKFKKGLGNSLYHIKTTKGDFVFKIVIRNSPYKIYYEIDLQNTITNLPIPKPIKIKNRGYLFDYHGYKAFIYKFLPGKETNKFSKQMLFRVGKFLAKLHLQTEGFSSSIKRIDRYALTPVKLKYVIQESNDLKHPKIKKAISYLKSNALKYKLSTKLPKGAMHMDVKPENTLFKKGHLSGVLDFDIS
mgnify:FL=1